MRILLFTLIVFMIATIVVLTAAAIVMEAIMATIQGDAGWMHEFNNIRFYHDLVYEWYNIKTTYTKYKWYRILTPVIYPLVFIMMLGTVSVITVIIIPYTTISNWIKWVRFGPEKPI